MVIWLLYLNQSTHRHVPMSLSTRFFVFMGCLVNSCPIETRGSQLSSDVPFSKHSATAYKCLHLTTLNQTVRMNAQIVTLKRNFEANSSLLRIGANFCRWWNSPSTTRWTRRRHTSRSLWLAYAIRFYLPFIVVLMFKGKNNSFERTPIWLLLITCWL